MLTTRRTTRRSNHEPSLGDLKRLEREFRALERAHAGAGLTIAHEILDKIRQGLCVFDGEQRLRLFNRRYAEMYGLRPEDLCVGMTFRDVLNLRYAAGTGPDMTKEAYASWRDQIQVADQVIETIVELRNGSIHEIHHEPMADGGWVATFDDITERCQSEARIQYMAHHDALTGLANRALFTERLETMVARFHAAGAMGALVCLDLDYFKEVNDTMGHPAGDELLKEVAHRIRSRLPNDALLARLGGDEFAIVLGSIPDTTEAIMLAQSVSAEINTPFHLSRGIARVGVSLGYAFCSQDYPDVTSESLLSEADRMLYRSKAARNPRYFG